MAATERSVSVTLRMAAQDYISNANKAKKSTEDFNATIQASSKRSKEHADALKKLGTGASLAGAAVALGIGKAVASFADFDAAMSAASAATGASGAALDGLRALAVKMGADTMYSATEAANAITEMGKAGVSTADIMGGGLAGALSLAAAGQLDVGRAGEIAATAMNQFGLAGKDIPHVADLLAAAAGKAQGSVDDMAGALKYVGPVAKSMGISIEQTTGVLAEFASQGIIGEQAGTSLRGVLLSLTAPSAAAKDAIDKYGIAVYDANGNMLGLDSIAQSLHDRLGGLDQATRNAALGQIFGNESLTAAVTLYQGGAKAVDAWTSQVNDAGYAQKQAAALTDNLQGDIERLRGSLETTFIKTGSSANSALRGLTQGLEDAVNVVGNIPAPLLLTSSALAAMVLTVPKTVSAYRDFKLTLDAVTASSTRASIAMRGLGAAGAVAAAGFASVEIQQFVATAQVATPETEGLAQSLRSLANGAKDTAQFGSLFAAGLGPFRTEVTSSADAIDQFGRNAKAALRPEVYEQFFGTAGDASAVFTKRVQEIDAALVQLVQSGHGADAAKVVDQLAASTIKYGGSADDVRRSFTGYNEAIATTSINTQGLTSSTDAAAQALVGAATQTEKFSALLQGLNNPVLTARDATRNWEASIDAATQSLKDNGTTLDVTTAKGRANQDALDGMAQAAIANVAAMEANGASQGQLQAALGASRAQLEQMATRFGLTSGQARAYADQVLAIPTTRATTVTANTGAASAAVRDFSALLDQATRSRTVTITEMIKTGTYPGGPGPGQNSDPTLGGLLPTKKAAGGYITGPGTSTSDSIPAYLSAGEYVLRASAVSRLGTDFLDRLNSVSSQSAQRFASGGLVHDISQMRFGSADFSRNVMAQALAAAAASRSGSSGPVVNVNGPINTFDTPRAIGQAIRTTFGDAMATAGLR